MAALVLLAMAGLTACDTVEDEAEVGGRYEAVEFETLVRSADSLFYLNLIEAGAAFELVLSRNGGQRSVQGHFMLPDGTFADTLIAYANSSQSAGSLDGVDYDFAGSFVTVQRDLRLGLNADTSGQPAFGVPSSFTILQNGERLRATTGAFIQGQPGSLEADTLSVTTLILQKQ